MKLSEYLLRLAHDNDELTRFKRSKQSAEDTMTAAGLAQPHRELLLSGSANDISRAVGAEMPVDTSAGVVAVPLTMSVCRTW